MKRMISLLLALITACALISGCAGGGAAVSTSLSPSPEPTPAPTARTGWYDGEPLEGEIYDSEAVVLARLKSHEVLPFGNLSYQESLLQFDIIELIQGVCPYGEITVRAPLTGYNFEEYGNSGMIYRDGHSYLLFIGRLASPSYEPPVYSMKPVYIPVNDDGTITEDILTDTNKPIGVQFDDLASLKEFILAYVPESKLHEALTSYAYDFLDGGTLEEIVDFGQYIIKASVREHPHPSEENGYKRILPNVLEVYKDEGPVRYENDAYSYFYVPVGECETGKEYYFILNRAKSAELYGLASKTGAIIPADDEDKATELMALLGIQPSAAAAPSPEPTAIGCDFAIDKEYSDVASLIEDILYAKRHSNPFLPDEYEFDQIDEFYRPTNIFEGMSPTKILAGLNSVIFSYSNEATHEFADFIWLRTLDPARIKRMADSLRSVEKDGIEYYFFPNSDYSDVFWTHEGKCFQAIVSPEYSDEEILAFLQYETIKVEP